MTTQEVDATLQVVVGGEAVDVTDDFLAALLAVAETGGATEDTLALLKTKADEIAASVAGNLAVIEQDAGEQTVFDYYQPASSDKQQIRYMGTSPQGTEQNETGWVVKRLTWTHLGDDEDHITELQTIVGIWDDRASLDWS